jgi:sugar phosphate isomerase/epimerase
MFLIGLNPYGFTHAVGLQAFATPRANPAGTGLRGFISIARDIEAQCLEFDGRWLAPLDRDELAALARELPAVPRLCSYWLQHTPGETLDEAIRATRAIGGATIRMHLTPVLEGARAKQGPKWQQMLDHARTTLNREAPKAADAGLTVAIENHQDLGSEELLGFAEEAGANVGIALDTGNPFAVGEDPVAFAQRVASRIQHVHLKDYVSQFTSEGFRLIRCPIGDGCVPLTEIADVIFRPFASEVSARPPLDAARRKERPTRSVTAAIEVGALDVRHVRVFVPDWWEGYPSRPATELRTALERLKTKRLDDNAEYRTPWEKQEPTPAIVDYEMAQLRRSVENLKALGWM